MTRAKSVSVSRSKSPTQRRSPARRARWSRTAAARARRRRRVAAGRFARRRRTRTASSFRRHPSSSPSRVSASAPPARVIRGGIAGRRERRIAGRSTAPDSRWKRRRGRTGKDPSFGDGAERHGFAPTETDPVAGVGPGELRHGRHRARARVRPRGTRGATAASQPPRARDPFPLGARRRRPRPNRARRVTASRCETPGPSGNSSARVAAKPETQREASFASRLSSSSASRRTSATTRACSVLISASSKTPNASSSMGGVGGDRLDPDSESPSWNRTTTARLRAGFGAGAGVVHGSTPPTRAYLGAARVSVPGNWMETRAPGATIPRMPVSCAPSSATPSSSYSAATFVALCSQYARANGGGGADSDPAPSARGGGGGGGARLPDGNLERVHSRERHVDLGGRAVRVERGVRTQAQAPGLDHGFPRAFFAIERVEKGPRLGRERRAPFLRIERRGRGGSENGTLQQRRAEIRDRSRAVIIQHEEAHDAEGKARGDRREGGEERRFRVSAFFSRRRFRRRNRPTRIRLRRRRGRLRAKRFQHASRLLYPRKTSPRHEQGDISGGDIEGDTFVPLASVGVYLTPETAHLENRARRERVTRVRAGDVLRGFSQRERRGIGARVGAPALRVERRRRGSRFEVNVDDDRR